MRLILSNPEVYPGVYASHSLLTLRYTLVYMPPFSLNPEVYPGVYASLPP